MNARRLRLLLAGAILAAATAASAAGCRPAAPGTDGYDVCTNSPPVPHPYHGVLRNARCDQHMFTSMASVATQLGVECTHCHVPLASDPKKQDYPVMTSKKEIANWMSTHMMQAVKLADGSGIRCKSCHTDENGKPVAKILGNPRDPDKASDWMSQVMVKKFVAADGSKLKCRSCHVGAEGSKEYAKVILKTDQIPKHQVGAKGTPSL